MTSGNVLRPGAARLRCAWHGIAARAANLVKGGLAWYIPAHGYREGFCSIGVLRVAGLRLLEGFHDRWKAGRRRERRQQHRPWWNRRKHDRNRRQRKRRGHHRKRWRRGRDDRDGRRCGHDDRDGRRCCWRRCGHDDRDGWRCCWWRRGRDDRDGRRCCWRRCGRDDRDGRRCCWRHCGRDDRNWRRCRRCRRRCHRWDRGHRRRRRASQRRKRRRHHRDRWDAGRWLLPPCPSEPGFVYGGRLAVQLWQFAARRVSRPSDLYKRSMGRGEANLRRPEPSGPVPRSCAGGDRCLHEHQSAVRICGRQGMPVRQYREQQPMDLRLAPRARRSPMSAGGAERRHGVHHFRHDVCLRLWADQREVGHRCVRNPERLGVDQRPTLRGHRGLVRLAIGTSRVPDKLTASQFAKEPARRL